MHRRPRHPRPGPAARVLRVACPWCGRATVRTDRQREATCPHCGHRTDVPRALCDCPACLARAQASGAD